ncbi:MAG: molybdopterin molybdotransferase MoeA [Proteobacteria bacterium]|nr:molybdopterin molybdotransferase MoeA [Pseudomonadota bacterium]
MTYPHSISFDQALKIIRNTVDLCEFEDEKVSINQANNRVLATDVVATINVPAFDCSSMDGFAIRRSDLSESPNASFTLQKPIYAGQISQALKKGLFAVPIMTGAMMPTGADSIVIKEHANQEGDMVRFSQIPLKDAFIRLKGQDIKSGRTVLTKGQRLRPQDLGLLASVGCGTLSVAKQLRIKLLLTGDELIAPGEKLKKGQIYESVGVMLKSLFENLNCHVELAEFVADDRKQVKQVLQTVADSSHDIVITVGGVSAGDKDFIKDVLLDIGSVLFHKTRIKPGFPLLFGRLDSALFFGIPGNPVSAFTTTCQLVLPAIRWRNKEKAGITRYLSATISHDIAKSHYRREFLRAHFIQLPNGCLEVTVSGMQQSSRISSAVESNCFLILDESQQNLKQGHRVKIQAYVNLLNPHYE